MRLKCHDRGRYSIIETSPNRNCKVLRQRETVAGQRSPLMRPMLSGLFMIDDQTIRMIDARQASVTDTGSWMPTLAIVRCLRSPIDLPSGGSSGTDDDRIGRSCHGSVSVQQNEICYMTFIIYLSEMAVQRWVDQCRLDLFDENMSRGEVESVTDA
jgi:hypothetical protein